jgi:hypothetical protein
MANQPLGVASTEGTAAAEQKNRLEQRGFAGTVAAPDKVVAGVEVQLRVLDAAEVVDDKLS